MVIPSIAPLWSTLWARRFGPEDLRLRFELGGQRLDSASQPIPRFLQAYHRASTVCGTIFSGTCIGVVAAWIDGTPSGAESAFDALRATGFQAQQIDEWRADVFPDPEHDESSLWTLRSFELSENKVARETLLWSAVASEISVRPSAPVVTFLIDPDTQILAHVYDDRGMDLIANSAMSLKEVYSTYCGWLLDYDRERMKLLLP